jgi:GMP synthase (glutamine-hydrolysing)
MESVSIIVLDFGSQYTQLIARRLREESVYTEIVPFFEDIEKIKAKNPKGIILSGGPESVYDKDAPMPNKAIFELGLPILGICYGMQLISYLHDGGVEKSLKHEYGSAMLSVSENPFFEGLPREQKVWMSHADKVTKLPEGFEVIATTANSEFAAIQNSSKNIYALQFHPEVSHSEFGKKMLANFAKNVCGIKEKWDMGHFAKEEIKKIQDQVGSGKVLCALSGGVDSSVTAALLFEAIGENLVPVFVDNGLLREGEREKVEYIFKQHLKVPLITVDASDRFLDALKDIRDPEEKRKTIGRVFIEVFEEESKKHENLEFLAQGTLYPDVIESVSTKGPSKTIKSHHNVGGLPERMNLKLIEPLRELFKDEVRVLGLELGLPNDMIKRHPFPGPGLAIRVMGCVQKDGLSILRKADTILLEEIKAAGFYEKLWQVFAVLLNVQSVGVMGDNRTYEDTIAIRAVESTDGMTADFAHLPHELLSRISNRIINEVEGVNRVVYDISPKPPSTIEWE